MKTELEVEARATWKKKKIELLKRRKMTGTKAAKNENTIWKHKSGRRNPKCALH